MVQTVTKIFLGYFSQFLHNAIATVHFISQKTLRFIAISYSYSFFWIFKLLHSIIYLSTWISKAEPWNRPAGLFSSLCIIKSKSTSHKVLIGYSSYYKTVYLSVSLNLWVTFSPSMVVEMVEITIICSKYSWLVSQNQVIAVID